MIKKLEIREREPKKIRAKRLEPKRLEQGDTIALIAPANWVASEKLEKVVEKIKAKGYKVEVEKSCTSKWKSFAGEDKIRLDDIHRAFADDNIKGIICLRGGYGSIRLLDKLDYELINNNPKIFVGYSDITSLHLALHKETDLITYHGPMGTSLLDDDNLGENYLWDLLAKKEAKNNLDNFDLYSRLGVLREGRGKGEVIGGNLAVFTSTLGTPYEVDTRGKILFLEEIGETTYKIDRMLKQLYQCGKFDGVEGVIFGDFNNCQKDKPQDFTLDEVLKELSDQLESGFVVKGYPAGHTIPNLTVIFGEELELNTMEKKEKQIKIGG